MRPSVIVVVILSLLPTISNAASTTPGSAAQPETPRPDIAGSQTHLLHSSSSSLAGAAGRETAGPDTFAIYGGPDRPLEGRFEDAAGLASWNGWTSEDLTDLQVYWHVDTFNAENLNGNGTGNHAAWSGQSAADQPEWASPPGYGNNWNDSYLYESEPVADPTQAQVVALDFYFNHELEPGYDFFIVEYDSAGIWIPVYTTDDTNKDGAGIFTAPGVRFSDVVTGSIEFAGNDYGGIAADRIRIRLRVYTDGAWSDEDGRFVSDAGAVQIDDITLTTSEGSFTEDFEGPGPYLFRPDKAPFAGDFAEVYPGFADIDPCRSNRTPGIGFLDFGQEVRNGPAPNGLTATGGSTSVGIAYGIPGNWTTNYTGGLSLGQVPIKNAVVSPVIDWDVPGAGDDAADFAGAFLRFDLWGHLPFGNGMFYAWEVRSAAAGEPFGPWANQGFVYYSSGGIWTTKQFNLSSLLTGNPERVQVRMGVLQFGFAGNGTPSPIFDKVSVYKYRLAGPQISGFANRLPNDSFAPSGSTDVSTQAARDALDIPIDMARDVNTGDLFVVPGDSITASVRALIPGTTLQDLRIVWALKTNPVFEDAIRTAPSAPNHQNVVAGPAGSVWSGETVAEFVYTSSGQFVADRYSFDLPDADFMYPGDVLQYYVKATDSDGRVSTVPEDISHFGLFDHIYPRYGTAYGLPSISDTNGSHSSILVLNDRGNEIGVADFRQSMDYLGLTEGQGFDMYWKRDVTASPNSNGIGTGGAHGASLPQLSGYSSILYFSRSNYAVLLTGGVGAYWASKSDDISLLEDWHRLAGRRNMAYFGDLLPSSLTKFPSGLAYLNQTMGVEVRAMDVVPSLGGNLSPRVQPQHAAFSTEFLAYFNCQIEADDQNNIGVVRHNHIEPAPGAVYGHQYVDPATGQTVSGPAASVVFPNPYPGVTGYDVTFPFSFSWIYPTIQRTVGPSDRTLLLQELLNLFAEDTSGSPVVAAPPARASLDLAIFPNPFNPRTVIHFDVRPGQGGSVKVFNLRGELVRTLHEGEFQTREFIWNGVDDRGASVASGVYVVRAIADGEVRIAKTALVR